MKSAAESSAYNTMRIATPILSHFRRSIASSLVKRIILIGLLSAAQRDVDLKTQPQGKLDLPGRCGCHRDDSELWRVDKALRSVKVGVIESIEELGSELELGDFT